jgi:hypothetical protein
MPGSRRILPVLADEQSAVLAEALGAIGQLHGKGLWQEDLHLDNLLRQGGQLYLIDGAGIAETGQPLSRQKVLENLGVFFAQLPKSLEPFTEELLVLPAEQQRACAAAGSPAETDRQGARLAPEGLPDQGRPRVHAVQRAARCIWLARDSSRGRGRDAAGAGQADACSIRAICTRPAARRALAKSRWPGARW